MNLRSLIKLNLVAKWIQRFPAKMSMTVKAYLIKKGEETREIRRFSVPADVSSNYSYLQKKIADIYPSLKQGNFNLYWTGKRSFPQVPYSVWEYIHFYYQRTDQMVCTRCQIKKCLWISQIYMLVAIQ